MVRGKPINIAFFYIYDSGSAVSQLKYYLAAWSPVSTCKFANTYIPVVHSLCHLVFFYMDREWRYPSLRKNSWACRTVYVTRRRPCFVLSGDFIARCVISYCSRKFFKSKHYFERISAACKAYIFVPNSKYYWAIFGFVWQACSLNRERFFWHTVAVQFVSIAVTRFKWVP